MTCFLSFSAPGAPVSVVQDFIGDKRRNDKIMYEVAITKDFSAAHSLKEIGGGCEALHGHNFTVEIAVASDDLDSSGVVVDFRLLKIWMEEVFEGLDHKYLNDLPYFADRNPSSENLARYIHDRLMEKTNSTVFHITRVTVWESASSRATYLPERLEVSH